MTYFRRRHAITVGVGTALCAALLASPALTGEAAAHAGHGLGQEMRAALAAAPDEVDGRCTRTVEVRGLGPSCATADGLFRVRGRSGETFTTHGADAPADASVASYATGSAQAVADAGPQDVQCVTAPASVKHTKLVYSYPSDQPSRFATVAPQLVLEAYKASAFLRAESRSVAPSRGVKLVLECDANGAPIVHAAQLSTAGGGDSFSTIVSDLKAAGYGANSSISGEDRLLVFHDSPVASGAAGTGHLYRDDRAGAGNASNRGGMVAVEYAWGGRPHWDVLLHELAHNMGAVQASAAPSSGAGHCNDGLDIMCYADGGSQSAYTASACSVELFDCGRDDYFNPAPAADSYLASHWNVAHADNRYLAQSVETPLAGAGAGAETGAASTTGGATTTRATNSPDTTAPARVRVVGALARGRRAVTLRWRATTDDVAVTRYQVYRLSGGAWKFVGSTSAAGRSFTNLRLAAGRTYSYRVRARDAAGNVAPASKVVRVRL